MRLFVDTSTWLALNDKGDQCHEQAVAKSLEIKTKPKAPQGIYI